MKKRVKIKNSEIKETNYKVASKVLISLLVFASLLLILLLAFYFVEGVPNFGSIFFIIIPIVALIVIFFITRNMYKEMVIFDKKVRLKEKDLDNKLKKKQEAKIKAKMLKLEKETEII